MNFCLQCTAGYTARKQGGALNQRSRFVIVSVVPLECYVPTMYLPT